MISMNTAEMRMEEDRLDMRDNFETELEASEQLFDAWWKEYRPSLRANTNLHQIASDAWRMGWLARSARIQTLNPNVAGLTFFLGGAGFGVIVTLIALVAFRH